MFKKILTAAAAGAVVTIIICAAVFLATAIIVLMVHFIGLWFVMALLFFSVSTYAAYEALYGDNG